MPYNFPDLMKPGGEFSSMGKGKPAGSEPTQPAKPDEKARSAYDYALNWDGTPENPADVPDPETGLKPNESAPDRQPAEPDRPKKQAKTGQQEPVKIDQGPHEPGGTARLRARDEANERGAKAAREAYEWTVKNREETRNARTQLLKFADTDKPYYEMLDYAADMIGKMTGDKGFSETLKRKMSGRYKERQNDIYTAALSYRMQGVDVKKQFIELEKLKEDMRDRVNPEKPLSAWAYKAALIDVAGKLADITKDKNYRAEIVDLLEKQPDFSDVAGSELLSFLQANREEVADVKAKLAAATDQEDKDMFKEILNDLDIRRGVIEQIIGEFETHFDRCAVSGRIIGLKKGE